MKNSIRHIFTVLSAKYCIIALMLLCLSQPPSYCQIPVFNEELYVQTDRDFYISGEKVYLKIYCLNRLTHKPSALSKVVYVSLLDSLNDPVVQTKIGINDFTGSGMIILPGDLGTGNYYLASCTRWLQNFSPDLFSYKAISVINPFEDPGKSVKKMTGSDPDTMTLPNSGDRDIRFISNILHGFDLSIKPGKPDYPTREKVRIEITATDPDGNPVESDLMVSVVKSFSERKNNRNLSSFIQLPDPAAPRYLPEPEWHLVSGKVHSTATGEPLKNENIVLSFVGKTARCRFTKTDENGIFNFTINETGKHEIVIQPLRPELTDYYVDLDNPFPEFFSDYKPAPLLIDTGRLTEINNAIISMQVQAVYEPYRDSGIYDTKKAVIHGFYGEPDLKVVLSTYIELSSLKEVFKELIPGVITYNKKGKAGFSIYMYPDHVSETNPIVLVDGVPVHDHDAVLRIDPVEIEQVKVLYSKYFISDIVFEGIIDITTKQGGLRVPEFDKPVFRQEFEALQPALELHYPNYSTVSQKESHIPDFRNTLYWDPDIRTDKNGRAVVEFFTSDETGNYKVLVEGFTSEGGKGSVKGTFSVSVK
jgi:hypothetical protein